jgi:hypothetical protein
MNKRTVLAPPVVAGLLYFFGHLYPWTRSCVLKAYPEAYADASSPTGVSAPVVVGPRTPLARLGWCMGLSLDRLNPFTPSPAVEGHVEIPLDSLSSSSDGQADYLPGVQIIDRKSDQGFGPAS